MRQQIPISTGFQLVDARLLLLLKYIIRNILLLYVQKHKVIGVAIVFTNVFCWKMYLFFTCFVIPFPNGFWGSHCLRLPYLPYLLYLYLLPYFFVFPFFKVSY